MTTPNTDPIVRFSSDTTQRWSCRGGYVVFWFNWKNIFVSPKQGLQIADFWNMEEGDFLTITNRLADIPHWFSLHPTEVCNRLAHQMTEKIKNDEYPDLPIEGPNIWRPKSGDRLAWIRMNSNCAPIISILDFSASALVLGESVAVPSLDKNLAFGSQRMPEQTKEEIAKYHAVVKFVEDMGTPRVYDTEWQLG